MPIVGRPERLKCGRITAVLAIAGAGTLMTVGSSIGHAQDRPGDQEVAEEPPETQPVRAIERGLFLQADVGVTVFVNELEGRRYDPGPQVGIVLGYDILSVLSLGVGVSLWGVEVESQPDVEAPHGDLFFVVPKVRAQLAIVTTERNFMWLRGEAGFGFGLPGEIDGVEYGGDGPVFGVSAGFERFTKLRHFAIGIHGGAVVVTQPDLGVGVSVMPTIKYTF